MGISWILIAISNYFYLPYQCAKDTKSAVPAVIILAITNIVLNYILVPRLGMFGVISTSIIGYSIVTFYLWRDTRKYFTLRFFKNTIVPILLILAGSIPFYLNHNALLDILYIVISYLFIFFSTPRKVRDGLILKIKNKMTSSKEKAI